MQTEVARRPFTTREYYRMLAAGILSEADRVELLAGEILAMTPMRPRHAGTLSQAAAELSLLLAPRAIVRVQLPIDLSQSSQPEPDIAVVRAREDRYKAAHPKPADIDLVIEIAEMAETTVRFDLGVKLRLYAEAAVREVWILDLNSNVVSIHRNPEESAYSWRRDLGNGDSIRPLAFPDLDLRLSKLFF